MDEKKRIMVIVWKWERLEHCAIGPEELEQYDEHPEIEAFRDVFFDEFRVASLEGENKKTSEDGSLVRVRVQKGEARNSIPFIAGLVRHYAGGENHVYIFLHRGEGFTSHEVKLLLDTTPARKCFLFGGGRDYLYSSDQHTGLISEGGKFYTRSLGKNRSRIKVADEKKKIIGQSYFDRVWNYYQHEFSTKIFELKEDLLRHFYSIYPSEEVWTRQRLEAHLKQNDGLWLRAKSFINDCYAKLDAPEEVKRLEEVERITQKPYLFDDCKRNLEQLKGIRHEYQNASEYLCNMIFNATRTTAMHHTLKQHLINIQHRFDELLMNLRQNESL